MSSNATKAKQEFTEATYQQLIAKTSERSGAFRGCFGIAIVAGREVDPGRKQHARLLVARVENFLDVAVLRPGKARHTYRKGQCAEPRRHRRAANANYLPRFAALAIALSCLSVRTVATASNRAAAS